MTSLATLLKLSSLYSQHYLQSYLIVHWLIMRA